MTTKGMTIEDMCIQLKPIVGDDIDKLYNRYRLASTLKEKAEIEQIINALYQKYIGSLLEKKILLNPPKTSLNADYPIGIIKYAEKDIGIFGLREHDWIRHILVSGMSGSGKTNLAFHILGNFIVKKKPFLVLDWKKSFRPLMTLSKDIYCFTIGNEKVSNFFRININIPPQNIPPKEWINIVCDIITESFGASYGVHKLLSEAMDLAFRDNGIYQGAKNYPTWYDIKNILEARKDLLKGREAEWLASALRVAHALTFGSFGEAINNSEASFHIEDLFDKQVLFELNSLNNSEKKFFAQFLLAYIYKLKKSGEGESTEDFRYAIVVDEAHNIFLKQQTHFITENITDMIYREVREYGISLICLDQHISKLSDTVAGNSATIIAFQQILPQDVEVVSKIMFLYDDRFFFSMLEVGYAIVKLAERHNEPFLIKVPFVKLKTKGISDLEIKDMMISKLGFYDYKNYTKEEATEEFNKELEEQNLKLETEDEKKTKSEEKKKPSKVYRDDEVKRVLNVKFQQLLDKGYKLEDVIKYFKARYEKDLVEQTAKNFQAREKTVEEKFLEYVKNNPGCRITEIYTALNISARKGNDIKNDFIEKGLIEIKEETSNKGLSKKVYITEDGLKYA